MKNLGSPDQGLTPAELASTVSKRLMRRTQKAVEQHLETLAKEAAEKKLSEELDKRLDDKDKKRLEALKSLTEK